MTPPSHFVTRYSRPRVVHKTAGTKLESWVALCGVTQVAIPENGHHGPTSCERCLLSERLQADVEQRSD